MTCDSTPASHFEAAGHALPLLALPPLQRGDVFHLYSSDFLCLPSTSSAIEAWELTAAHFLSEEDYRLARQSRRFWVYEHQPADRVGQDNSQKHCATSLHGLLGAFGEQPETQRAAIAAFEEFLPTHTLAFNDYREDVVEEADEMDNYLSDQMALRLAKQFVPEIPLFDDTPSDQADLAQAKQTGLWSVLDQVETMTVSTSSTLGQALAKVWATTPCLDAYRRMMELDHALPAPTRRSPGARF